MSETKRVRRTPINGTRNKLTVIGKEPGWEYHWPTAVDGRIQDMLDKGYEFVPKDKTTVGDKRVADATPMGSAQTIVNRNGDVQYLMRIRTEWKQEDDKLKAADVDKSEETLRQNAQNDGLQGVVKLTK